MKRYVALLRGINVGGHNKLAMADLKIALTELGYLNVVSHLNSGNLIFSSPATNTGILANEISGIIKQRFNLTIPAYVTSQSELADLISHAPNWWGRTDKEIYDNLIFILPPLAASELLTELGEPNKENEQIFSHQNSIFWSFIRKENTKTNWWSKTASTKLKNQITIRTANTVRKIVTL